MADLSQIGNALQGFSAGVQGQLPQFIQGQQNQRTLQLAERKQAQVDAAERQKTMYTDAMAGLNLIKAGNLDGFLSLGAQRLQLLGQLAQDDPTIDPSDTQRMMQLGVAAKNGSPEALKLLQDELASVVEVGTAIGVLKAPERDKGVVVGGELRNPYTGERIGAEAATQTPESFRALELRANAAGLTPGTEEYQSFMAQGGRQAAEPSLREREARIQEYMSNFGLSRQDAISRLDAQYMTDPVTGNLIAVDRATGGASIPSVATGDRPAAIPAPPPVDASALSFDPGKGTGAGASFIGLWNSTVGQIPFAPTFMGPETAAQQLTILERDAIKALASSDRPAVVEQNRILGAIPKAMDWTENPNVARSKMTSFIDLMTNQYVDDLRYAKDLSQPKNLRETSATRARAIEGIMNRVLTPEAATAMMDSIKGVEADLNEINSLPFDKLQTIQLENLSDAALDAYIQRIENGR